MFSTCATLSLGDLIIIGERDINFATFVPAEAVDVMAQRADLGAGREPLDEVDNIVTGVVSNPASAQLSPSSFFVRTSSSTTSASTSVLFRSLASSAAPSTLRKTYASNRESH